MAPSRRSQTRLQFTPVPSSSSSSSPSKKEYSPSVQDRLANVRFKGAKERQAPKSSTSSILTPEPSSQPVSAFVQGSSAAISRNQDEDDIESPTTKRRRVSSNRPRQTTLTPRRSSRIQFQTPTHTRIRPSSPASSSSSQRLRAVEVPSPISARLSSSPQAEKAILQSSPPTRISTHLSDLGSPETSGDNDDIIATKPALYRKRSRKPAATRDVFVVSDNDEVIASSDGDDGPVTPSRRRKSSVANHTPRSRRLKSRREHQEVKEDLEDLQNSDSPQLQSTRTRGAPVNKERERRRKYIELLKRRRAGEKEPILLETDDDDEEAEDIDNIAHYASNASATFFDRRKNTYSENTASEDDEVVPNTELDVDEVDFVVPDEEGAPSDLLGRPHPDIPLEFTSYASAKPRDLFIFVIEWLVKNKIAPAFPRHDPLWKLAFSKIKDEVTALAGSRLKSSAWTGPFMNALNARPDLTTTHLLPGEDFLRSCDACNRTNHPAQYDFVFSGSAYHHDSLEPVDPDSASDGGIEDGTASVDSHGHVLPPTDTSFFLGRYCAANAELAHRFTHWKYNLNESLMAYLESQGILSADEILRRERSKGGQRKREREAEEIVDQMKVTGVIDEVWKNFKADLDDARIGMEGFNKKGGRGNKRIGSVRVAVSEVLGGVNDGGAEKAETDFVGEKTTPTTPKQGRLKMNTFASDEEGE